LGCPSNLNFKAFSVTQSGVEVKVFDAREMKLNFPGTAPTPDALAMTKAIHESTGVIIATPEYHVRSPVV
jgi:chromate reductase